MDIIVDTGASTNIVDVSFPLTDEFPTPNGIKVRSCTNGIMTSTSKGNLPTTKLPPAACTAHRMSVNASLLSVGQAADAGCVSIFTKEKVLICDGDAIEVTLHKPPLLEGRRGNHGLWHIPLKANILSSPKPTLPVIHCANSAYTQSTMTDLAQYLHACAGYPVIETWCRAIQAGNYRSWPQLSAHRGPSWIRKHLPKQITTTMGHMAAIRQNVRSTKDTIPSPSSDPDQPLEPPRPHTALAVNHQVACGVVDLQQARHIQGLVCSDLPGRFPFTSAKGNNYIFVLYDYDSNAIIGKPIKSRHQTELVRGYQQCYSELRAGNITPILHRLDNEVNTDLFAAIKANECNYQLVTAYDHRQNLAERAIRTFKEHFISVLHGADRHFPANLWCTLIEQVNTQINLLRQSRITQRRSAYAELHGHFDFNSTPLAILGSRAVIYEPVSRRTTSFADHGKEGWYIGACMLKYRNYRVYIPATRGERESNRVEFFPTKCRLPNTSDASRLAAALEDLRHELHPKLLTPQAPNTPSCCPWYSPEQSSSTPPKTPGRAHHCRHQIPRNHHYPTQGSCNCSKGAH